MVVRKNRKGQRKSQEETTSGHQALPTSALLKNIAPRAMGCHCFASRGCFQLHLVCEQERAFAIFCIFSICRGGLGTNPRGILGSYSTCIQTQFTYVAKKGGVSLHECLRRRKRLVCMAQ